MRTYFLGILFVLCYASCFPSPNYASQSDSLSFVVSGNVSNATQFPYHVSFFYENADQSSFFLCSGAIINESHVVTSASAVWSYLNTTITIYAGSNEYMAEDGKQFFVSRFQLHENYTNGSYENDIALFQVRTNFTFTNLTQSIGISTNWTADTSLPCTVSSFADPKSEDPETGVAQFLEWINTTVATCPGAAQPSDSLYCAVDATNKTQATNASDKGSPMVCNSKLVGVVTNSPSGYFTNITKYHDWIFPPARPPTVPPSNHTEPPSNHTEAPPNPTATPAGGTVSNTDSFLSSDVFKYTVAIFGIAVVAGITIVIIHCVRALH